jgi:ribosome recycling factor
LYVYTLDESNRCEKEVQKVHDAFVKKAAELTAAKEKNIISS